VLKGVKGSFLIRKNLIIKKMIAFILMLIKLLLLPQQCPNVLPPQCPTDGYIA
tara:strand:+ start:119 stop:277 length:159 start_codon:yes stop_codon:yes gene_type:complete